MALTPTQAATLAAVSTAATPAATPWFDDNPLGWEILPPPYGSKYSDWDFLSIGLGSEPGDPFPVESNTFFAEVTGHSAIRLDKKQTPGKNAAILTVIDLAADEIHTLLYLFTYQTVTVRNGNDTIDISGLEDFLNLIPNRVMAVTAQDLISAAGSLGSAALSRLNTNAAVDAAAAKLGQSTVSSTVTAEQPATPVPLCVLTHPKLQAAGRSLFMLKSMQLIQEPRNGNPAVVELIWVPQEVYQYTGTQIKTATITAISNQINGKPPSSAAVATPPSSSPPAP